MTRDELYSAIEAAIIRWNLNGTKTAGSLTREIISIIDQQDNSFKVPISEWETGVDEQGGYWVDPITDQKWRWEKTHAEQKITR
jgi:hypothetical protein